jgi:hypothetical protein
MNEQTTRCECHVCTQARLSQFERTALQTDSGAEKDARREVAVTQIFVRGLAKDVGREVYAAIIKEAQG